MAELIEAQLERCTLASGVQLHFQRGPHRPGAANLVFIHGAMGDWRNWEGQWAHFTSHFNCVTYSRRYSYPNENHMASPDHCALQEADDLLGLLDHLGWSKVHGVGSSYGGYTVLALAMKAPERLHTLVAVEPPMMKYADRTEVGKATRLAFRRDTIEPANAKFRAGLDEEGARIMTGGISGAANVAAMDPEAMRKRLQNIRAMKMLALSSDEFPWFEPDALAKLKIPCLMISGKNSPAIHREIFKNVCAVMPQARVLEVDGAGHGVSRDAPELFNREVLAFLQAAGVA